MCQTSTDVLFLLDGSNSVSEADWGRTKDFVKRVVSFFAINETIGVTTRVALASYRSVTLPMRRLRVFTRFRVR